LITALAKEVFKSPVNPHIEGRGQVITCDALYVEHLKFAKFKFPPYSPNHPGGGQWGIILIGA